MPIVTDRAWEKLAEAAGGLPPEARAEVEKEIQDYMVEGGAPYNRVLPETRETLSQAQKNLGKLTQDITLLEESSDFRSFNAQGAIGATSLTRHLTALSEIRTSLDHAKERLSKRSRKNWPRIKLGSLFIELLEIRSHYLSLDVPTQAAEKSSGGRFHQYLQLCLELAEPRATNDERAAKLKEGLGLAVTSFQARKSDSLYSWQWPDLFPQTWHKMKIKNSFD